MAGPERSDALPTNAEPLLALALASPGARVYNPAMAATRPKPVVLCVLDGWGHREETGSNAIALAATPALDRLRADAPHALLDAASTDVGLPPGQIGNSEVGHMNLGAGRVVLQDLPRADAAIADGSLFESPVFADLAAALEASGGTCHVLGLLSPGGVHAHQAHIAAMVRALAARGLAVAVHAFLDGRDTPPRSAQAFLDDFLAAIAGAEGAAVATVSGRYYAMDRDRRWPRVERAHAAIAHGRGVSAASAADALARADAADIGDEFVVPTVVGGYGGMRDGDGLVMMNFRADRVREILSALVDPDFDGFRRARPAALAGAVGLTSYSAELDRRLGVLLPPRHPTSTLGEVLARAGLAQLRIAETEKYAHVTFFFNGGREEPFAGEERILVPSPQVATYDRKPEMAAREVADRLVAAIAGGRFDFILANFANTDMVGHTGVLAAAVRAVETVDECIGRIADAVGRAGGALIVTADHGNAELMFDAGTGQAHTAHTTHPVPCLLIHAPARARALRAGRLADLAPTVLDLLGIDRPGEMTGRSLIVADRRPIEAAAE